MLSPSIFVYAGLAGVLSHLLIFIHGEWGRQTSNIAVLYLVVEAIGLLYYSHALPWLMALNLGYFVGLFASIVIYRIFFHRLRHIPGPFLAKVTAGWAATASYSDSRMFKRIQGLHEQYGDFVRIKPREVSINHADAVRDIHGASSPCTKGPMYDSLPGRSLQTTRDRVEHATRRRVWERGLNQTALSDYESRLLALCNELHAQLSSRTGTPVNITEWLHFFSFDVMGDMILGKTFNMVHTGKPHFALEQGQANRKYIGPLLQVPWVLLFLQRVPFLESSRTKYIRWCSSQLEERSKMTENRTDLFTYLLGNNTIGPRRTDIKHVDLVYDTELAIGAGSGTTGNTLCALFHLLAKHPEVQQLLQEELDQVAPSLKDISHRELQNASYLNACIHETLRLYPDVPSGLPRMTPPGGATIAGRFIPGNIGVSTPTYTLHRDSRYFVEPNSFIPERWTSRPELIHRKDAFNPFLIGPYSCVGKGFAMMEMRLLVSTVLSSFSVRFVDTDKDIGGIFEDSTTLKEYFTFSTPVYQVILTKRERQGVF